MSIEENSIIHLPDDIEEHLGELVLVMRQAGSDAQEVKALIDQLGELLDSVQNNVVVVEALATALWSVLQNERQEIHLPEGLLPS